MALIGTPSWRPPGGPPARLTVAPHEPPGEHVTGSYRRTLDLDHRRGLDQRDENPVEPVRTEVSASSGQRRHQAPDDRLNLDRDQDQGDDRQAVNASGVPPFGGRVIRGFRRFATGLRPPLLPLTRDGRGAKVTPYGHAPRQYPRPLNCAVSS